MVWVKRKNGVKTKQVQELTAGAKLLNKHHFHYSNTLYLMQHLRSNVNPFFHWILWFGNFQSRKNPPGSWCCWFMIQSDFWWVFCLSLETWPTGRHGNRKKKCPDYRWGDTTSHHTMFSLDWAPEWFMTFSSLVIIGDHSATTFLYSVICWSFTVTCWLNQQSSGIRFTLRVAWEMTDRKM